MSAGQPRTSTGIVLSGGGARGAYEAGVVQGIMEALQPQRAPFDVLCGTSVGALNAAYLGAHAHLPDMGASRLVDDWRQLDVATHLQLDLRGLLGWKRDWTGDDGIALPKLVGRSLLDARALEGIVRDHIRWSDLHRNVQSGLVRSLVVSALHIASGRTTLFAELAPGVEYAASRDPRRRPSLGPIDGDMVLASAAIPLLFPARRVGTDYYCDGGMRFNTPIAPAIRTGAQRLVVISLLSQEQAEPEPGSEQAELEAHRVEAYNSPIYLIGKVLNALLLDPLRYDLQVLDRLNRLLEALESTLDPAELAAVQRVIRDSRGLPYNRVQTLVFRPSRDVGLMARARGRELQASRFSSWLLARAAKLGSYWESDLVSFILFDSAFAEELIALGRQDALGRADEIRAFFAEDP